MHRRTLTSAPARHTQRLLEEDKLAPEVPRLGPGPAEGKGLLSKRLATGLLLAFLVPTVAFAYPAVFARYVADDYRTASTLLERGFIGAQQAWYLTWSGKFTYILLIDALAWLGPWTVPLTPLVLLPAWVFASTAVLRALVARIGAPRISAVLLALVLITTTLGGAPQLWQSLYWQTGSVVYTVPLILATIYGRHGLADGPGVAFEPTNGTLARRRCAADHAGSRKLRNDHDRARRRSGGGDAGGAGVLSRSAAARAAEQSRHRTHRRDPRRPCGHRVTR
jgi:hypothetical protein